MYGNFCNTFSIHKEEVFRRGINDIFAFDFLDVVLTSIRKIVADAVAGIEFTYSNEQINKIYSGNISYTDDRYEEERIYIISLKDITQQILYEAQLKKTIEKESQLNKLKSIFIENMSHEMRTPYNALIGYSEILDDEIKEGNLESTVEIMSSLKEVFGRVLVLFANIIEVSQIESNEIIFSKVRMNCNKILLSIYEMYKDKAESKKLGLKVVLEENDCMIEVDWMKLEKIMEVLVDNAVKYTDRGDILLETRQLGNALIITVADSGIGMNESDIGKFLEPFGQEEDVYTSSYQGAGLGLTIAHKLTKLMGGEFKIESQREKGTEIKLIFPLCKDKL